MFEILSFFAFFTILSNIFALGELSFTLLAYCSFIPLFFTIVISRNKAHYIDNDEHLHIATSHHDKTLQRVMIAGIVLCIFITLFSIRAEPDEAFYSSIETHALDNPELPLIKYDGMFGEKDVPILHESYKLASYQTLSAVISYWTGISPPLVRHIIFPLIATLLFFITWTKLFKLFVNNHWQSAMIIFICLILLLGGFRGITHYSITRFYDGKCVLANIIMPLFLYYSILYFRNPSHKKLIYLTLIQISGLGLSTSALFLLPLKTLIMAVINYKPTLKQTKTCFFYGLTSTYLIIGAAIIKYKVMQSDLHAPLENFIPVLHRLYPSVTLRCILEVLGGNPIANIISLIAIFSAYRFVPKDSDLRTFLFYTPLIVFFIILNPLFVDILSISIGKYIYWRLFLLIPTSLFITIFIIGISTKLNLTIYQRSLTIPFFILLLILPYENKPHGYQSNYYHWNPQYFFLPRLHPDLYNIATTISKHTQENTLALAPDIVSECLAGIPQSPKLVAVNVAIRQQNGYLAMLQHYFPDTAYKRTLLHNIISGHVHDFNLDIFSQYLKDLNVGTVTMHSNLAYKNKVKQALMHSGYHELQSAHTDYDLWVK